MSESQDRKVGSPFGAPGGGGGAPGEISATESNGDDASTPSSLSTGGVDSGGVAPVHPEPRAVDRSEIVEVVGPTDPPGYDRPEIVEVVGPLYPTEPGGPDPAELQLPDYPDQPEIAELPPPNDPAELPR